MECPALEEFSYKGGGTLYEQSMSNLMVDSLVLLLNRSDSRLKKLQLYMDGEEDLAVEDFKKSLNAIPSLQHLCLSWHSGKFFMDELLQKLSSSAPILEGGTPGFLPHLQSLTLFSYSREVLMWEYIPHIYTWPHRKLLCLDLRVDEVEMDDNTSDNISQLIAQGISIRIRADYEDYFQKLGHRIG
jgi:hypothetical protein